MVGGHAPIAINEVIYSLQFPERPGALLRFLSSLGSQWNISLFHYRNHGAAFMPLYSDCSKRKRNIKPVRQ
jgi:threonine dehydratase